MILKKYQPSSLIQERGYSSTCQVTDSASNTYFAKWIKGIKENSQARKILFDKLRHLKRAEHTILPKIIDYGWDEMQNAPCIISEYKNTQTLEEVGYEIPPIHFFKGIMELINCLQLLNTKYQVVHGDITPANILVDKTYNFYLIDFGIADMTATLSQTQDLVIFAQKFAAPEKWDRSIAKGFSFQSDIYSLGKVIEWYFQQQGLTEFEELKSLIDLASHKQPTHRINYNAFADGITHILNQDFFEEKNVIEVKNAHDELLEELNNEESKPLFDILPDKGDNILVNIATRSCKIHCLWLVNDKQLLVRNYTHKEEDQKNYDKTKRYGRKLDFPIIFKQDAYPDDTFDLTPHFQKIQKQKQANHTHRGRSRKIKQQLGFYKDLLNKELEVLEKNSLRLRYVDFKTKGEYEIHFKIAKNEKYSTNPFISQHIEAANPPNPTEFEYILSPTADKKQIKRNNTFEFSGIPYDFDFEEDKRILKFKDCEKLKFDKIPRSGYLFQSIRKEEEEKKRQLEAIRKVEFGEAQNRHLVNALFFPKDLEASFLDTSTLNQVFQRTTEGQTFQYSPNQTKAIVQALERKPLTIIQGPPGTGKTTVITEIVFQILHREPHAKVLITSQTNSAVDNVLDNLLKNEIPIVRLSGVRQPKESLRKHTLERKIEGWKLDIRKKAISNWKKIEQQFKRELKADPIISSIVDVILQKKDWKVRKSQLRRRIERISNMPLSIDHLDTEASCVEALAESSKINITGFFEKRQLHKDWLATISSLDKRSKLNQKLIDNIKVVGATANHIAAGKYKAYNFEFDYVIMDESGKATLAESLVPLTMGNKAVLVGDHRQLRPMLTSNQEVEKWLRKTYKENNQEFDSFDDYFNRPSLFETVIKDIDDDFKSQLEVCRRCSEDQVQLISKCFYEPFGDEKIRYHIRPPEKEHNLDLKIDSSIIFLDIGNTHRSRRNSSQSSYNPQSAELIPKILSGLDQFEKVRNYDIGVITGYTAQLQMIRKKVKYAFRRRKLKNIDIHSKKLTMSVVDRFQGLEKDIIIFDLVRSQQGTLGFLANANRINVALSRQKKLLIIIGNYDWLLSAKSPNTKEKIALQQYLQGLKKDWIVKRVEQIF